MADFAILIGLYEQPLSYISLKKLATFEPEDRFKICTEDIPLIKI